MFILPILASCNETGNEGKDTTLPNNDGTTAATTTDPVETDPPITTEGYVIPEEHDYDGATFNIMVGAYSNNNDFRVEEGATDVLSSARFNWMEACKEEFNIDILYKEEFNGGAVRGGGPGYIAFNQSYIAGETHYNIGSISVYDAANAAKSGILSDIKNFEYIDLEKSWWDQKANEQLTIRNKMYFTTGDISTIDNKVTQVVFFNKSLLEEIGLEDPYELVNNDKWYWDKFEEMVLAVSNDENGDDVMDFSDKYGLLTCNDAAMQVYSFAGEAIAKVDENGDLVLTAYNERIAEIFERYTNLFHDYDHVISSQFRTSDEPSSKYASNRIEVFADGRALLHFHDLGAIEDYRDMEIDFGILPWPKYDEQQEDYGHLMTPFPAQVFCIPVYHGDDEMVGAISEFLAATGQEITKPAYYEKSLKGTYFRDDESAAMLDIIFATHTFDVGNFFRVGDLYTNIWRTVNRKFPTYTVLYNQSLKKAESDIKKINSNFDDFDQ